MADVRPAGIHHVTAIAEDPQANVDFCTQMLGLRLIEQTVNSDATDTYPLHYGDAVGSPSSIPMFFPWRGVPDGKNGAGLATASSVPPESIGWWQSRLSAMAVDADAPLDRDGTEVLTLRDPHGLVIDLVASPVTTGWAGTAPPASPTSTPSAACTRSPSPRPSSSRPTGCSPSCSGCR